MGMWRHLVDELKGNLLEVPFKLTLGQLDIHSLTADKMLNDDVMNVGRTAVTYEC